MHAGGVKAAMVGDMVARLFGVGCVLCVGCVLLLLVTDSSEIAAAFGVASSAAEPPHLTPTPLPTPWPARSHVPVDLAEWSSSRLSACAVAELGACGFAGPVLTAPSARGWANATRIDNRRAVTRPAVVAVPRTDDDAACAVLAASACGLPFAALSGGHSAAGYGLCNGCLVLSLRDPAAADLVTGSGGTLVSRAPTAASRGAAADAPRGLAFVDPVNATTGVIRVGAGARFADVYAAVAGTGWVPVGGGCPQVGVGGFLLGGGWSFLSRSYGLGCDNVEAVDVVVANGSVVRLDAAGAGAVGEGDLRRELWWAMCGGGGGNFGVATAFELRLARPAPIMLVGELCWPPFSDAPRSVFSAWLSAWSSTPRWLDVDPVWLPLGPNASRLFCVTVVCNNADARTCDDAVAPYRAVPGATVDTLRLRPFLDWQMANVNATDAQEGMLYLKSGVLAPGALTLDTVEALQAALHDAPSARNLVLFHVGGGAVADKAPNATAFPHRGLQLIVQVKAIWDDPSAAAAEANVAWVTGVFRVLAPLLSGAYINYIDPLQTDWQRAYYGSNYARLQRVKQAVDPGNFFRFAQSIELPQRASTARGAD